MVGCTWMVSHGWMYVDGRVDNNGNKNLGIYIYFSFDINSDENASEPKDL